LQHPLLHVRPFSVACSWDVWVLVIGRVSEHQVNVVCTFSPFSRMWQSSWSVNTRPMGCAPSVHSAGCGRVHGQ
jgi:hypothetical protein